MSTTVHFRCTFDVRPASPTPVGLSHVVRAIATWIRSKEGRSLELDANHLLKPGSRRRPDGRAAVATDSLPDDGKPELWALRYEHQDSNFSPRRWCTDFGIVQNDAERWRISATVSHRLHTNYIGREPGQLPITAPRVIRALLTSDQFRCEAGTVALSAAPRTVHVGEAHHFVRAITDPGRACPIVYVSVCRLTGEPLIDPAELASTILGTGVVFVAASPDIDEELEFLMVPREFRSPNGTVRVYAPGLDVHAAQQAYRHRFFTKSQILEQSAAEVAGQIARALTRRQAWARMRSSVGSIEDIAQRRRESRRTALQRESDAASRDELATLFEEENVRLSAKVADLEGANEELAEDLDERDGQLDQLKHEADYYRVECEQLREKLSAAETASERMQVLRQLPKTVAEVAQLMEQLHPGRIALTQEAKKSAERATLDDPNVAWECLHALATVLPKLAFEESSSDIAACFRSETGFDLALTESSTTNRDASLVKLRKITFDGGQWDISPHVKYGTKPPKCLRVHFALDVERKRVIVGHCGDHLKTAGTRRRKGR